MRVFTYVIALCMFALVSSCTEEIPNTEVTQELPSSTSQSLDVKTAKDVLVTVSRTDQHTNDVINQMAKRYSFEFDLTKVETFTNLQTNVQVISFPTNSPYTLSIFLSKPYEKGGDLYLAGALYTKQTVEGSVKTIDYLTFDDRKFMTIVSDGQKLVSVDQFDVVIQKNYKCNWWCYFMACADQYVQLITGQTNHPLDPLIVLACAYDGAHCAIAGLAGCAGWATAMTANPRDYKCCDWGSMPTPPMNF